MKRSEVNKCPERAYKRARGDLRCAAKKLGIPEARKVLAELAQELDDAELAAAPALKPTTQDAA
jgi:hypothetical protein